MTTIAWINNETNICDNVTGDIRPISELSKEGYQLIDLDQTITVEWLWNGTEWVMEDRNFGEGGIGDLYENGKLIKPKPSDPPVQPVTTGTQEL